MKAKDLRIGNTLLLYGNEVKIIEIGLKHHTDTNYYIRVEGGNCGYWIDQFKPILLNDTIHQILSNTDFLANFNNNLGDNWNEYWIEFKGVNIKRVRYLHELENLLYELKGVKL